MSLAHVAIPAALRGVHREDDAFALAAAWGFKASGLKGLRAHKGFTLNPQTLTPKPC